MALDYKLKHLYDATYACTITTPDDKIDWETQKVDGKPILEWIKSNATLQEIQFSIQEKDTDLFVDNWTRLMAFLPDMKVCAFVRLSFSSTVIFGFSSFGFLNLWMIIILGWFFQFSEFSCQDFLTVTRHWISGLCPLSCWLCLS